MNAKHAHKYIAAFADGELSVEQNLEVLEVMTMSPQTTRRIMHQQQLRQAVQRHVREHTPPVPQSLRKQIEQMARDAAQAPPVAATTDAAPAVPSPGGGANGAAAVSRSGRGGVLSRLGRNAPALAAAVVLGALLSAVFLSQSGPGWGRPSPSHAPAPGLVLTSAQAERFAGRHDRCARDIATLRGAASYPTELERLPEAVAQRLALSLDEVHRLDLSASGYEFWRAGDCRLPGDRSVHLIYRTMPETGRDDTLSLWIMQDTQHRLGHLVEGKAYWVAGEEKAHPMVVWRRGRTIHYLMGNQLDCVQRATRTLLESA